MDLLRKCPGALWRCKPIRKHRGEMRVGVAVDPVPLAAEGRALSVRLLRKARSLADSCSGELAVVSCWDFPFEKDLRENVWLKTPKGEVADWVAGAE